MSASEPRLPPIQWPEGTDREVIEEFDRLRDQVETHLARIEEAHEAGLARLRRRRWWIRVAFVVQLIGLALCVTAMLTMVEWLYWVGYTMVVSGIIAIWWQDRYFHKLWNWTRRKVGQWRRSRS